MKGKGPAYPDGAKSNGNDKGRRPFEDILVDRGEDRHTVSLLLKKSWSSQHMIICDLRNHKDNSWSENAENF